MRNVMPKPPLFSMLDSAKVQEDRIRCSSPNVRVSFSFTLNKHSGYWLKPMKFLNFSCVLDGFSVLYRAFL